MTHAKKHSDLLYGAMLVIVAFVVIASPFSVSFERAGSLAPNIAYAQSASSDGATADASAKADVARTSGCSGIVDCITALPKMLFRVIISLTAAMLIYVSSWILTMSGLLFNWLVDHTIVQFGTLYGSIKSAIEIAWTAFRDIANILIIGIFTFIAISIILGLKEYGQKRMIANVLIIAVLINFSLLFTKMIIDASNYTATQVYAAAALGGDPTTGTNATNAASATDVTNTFARAGIAGQFMNLLGVGTFGNAYKLVNDSAVAQDSLLIAALHGLLVMIVLLGAAIVLLYGCFLLVSRMIMLIFLLVTASIAFASYLVPAWAGSGYGWSAWWSSLLWCASFAPILMFLLWMTLNVSSALKTTSKGTLGGALSDPTNGSNIDALFIYVMVLGMLFATFKLSSMWAHKISGFNIASMVPGIPAALGLRLAGLGFQGTIGKYQARRSSRLEAEAKAAEARGDIAERNRLLGQARGIGGWRTAAAKRDFNLMNTTLGKKIVGIDRTGLKGVLTGESKDGGYKKHVDDRAKLAVEQASKVVLSEDDRKKMREEASKVAMTEKAPELKEQREERMQQVRERKEDYRRKREEYTQKKEDRQQALKVADEDREKQKQSMKETREGLEKQGAELQRRNRVAQDDKDRGRTGADERLAKIAEELAKHTETMKDHSNKEKIELQARDSDISRIAQDIQVLERNIQGTIVDEKTDVTEAVNELRKDRKETIGKRTEELTPLRARKGQEKSESDVAGEIAEANWSNTDIAKAARKLGKQNQSNKQVQAAFGDRIAEMIKAQQASSQDSH